MPGTVGDGTADVHARRCRQCEVLGRGRVGGDRRGRRLTDVPERGDRDLVLAGREQHRVRAVGTGGELAVRPPADRDLRARERGLPVRGVRDLAGQRAGVADRCRVQQCQGVQPALAVHVVVVGRAAALRVGLVDRGAVQQRAGRGDVTASVGDADHSSAIAPATCGLAIDVPVKFAYPLPGTLDRTFMPGAEMFGLISPSWPAPRPELERCCC